MTIGQKAYEAYLSACDIEDSKHLGRWSTLPEIYRQIWEKTANSVRTDLDTIMSRHDIHVIWHHAMHSMLGANMPDVMALIDELYENYK